MSTYPTQLFIDGAWKTGDDNETFPVFNPATGEVITEVASATLADASAALTAATEASDSWAETPGRQRATYLWRLFDAVNDRAAELADCMCTEMGKPLDQAQAEVHYGAEFLRWFAEEAPRLHGDTYPTPEGNLQVMTMKRPVGPCLFITPWNFPLAMATRKIAPALAAGCTTILKPSVETPLTALLFAQIVAETGLPAGVVNVIPTAHSAAVTAPLLTDSRLRKLSFTGSTETGQVLLKQAADNVLRISMELGGLAPFIVFEDADLTQAISAAVATKIRNMGEACNASSRFYIHHSLVEEFTAGLTAAMSALTIGDGHDDGVDVGPLISKRHLDKVADLVQRSLDAGAKLQCGGHVKAGPGYFYEPTVISDVAADNPLLHEEVFGPVAPICAFSDETEVMELANDTNYGLAGYVHTRDTARMMRIASRLEVGMIGFNSATISNAAAPFGGVKASGLGREGGFTGIEEFVETIYLGFPR